MSTICQSHYKKAVNALSRGKRSGSAKSARNSVKQFVNFVQKDIALIDTETLIFSDYIYDNDMLFSTVTNEYSLKRADIKKISDGLLTQVLEILDIKGKKISKDIKSAIEDLHSQLSRGVKEIDEEKATLYETLEELNKML